MSRNLGTRSSSARARRLVVTSLASALVALAWPLLAGVTPASAAGSVTLYAFPGGAASGPANSSCTVETSTTVDCSLQAALTTSEAYPEETVTIMLETDNATPFLGTGYTLDLEGSSVFIDGNDNTLDASSSGPGSGPLLSVSDSAGGGSLQINQTTFTGANASDGAALDLLTSDVVTVTSSNFLNNVADGNGGAIDSADAGSGTLNLNFDRFTNNYAANDGGAIDAADAGGSETVNDDDSFFAHDVAGADGGAIDLGDHGGDATITDSYSSFHSDSAGVDGGALDAGDHGGSGTVNSEALVLSQDVANGDGGAIDLGDNGGGGALTDGSSTFTDDAADINGGALDAADFGGAATLTMNATTFSGNTANLADVSGLSEAGDGGAVDLADGEAGGVGHATATLTGVGFTDNVAYNCGGALDIADSGTAHVTITSASFVDNTSTTGNGGALNNGDAAAGTTTTLVSSSIFTGNNGGSFGGAIANADAVGASAALLGVVDSYFADNASTNLGLAGGAISNGTYGGEGLAIIEYSTFQDNGELAGVDYPDRGSALMNGSTGEMVVLRDTVDAGPVAEAPLYTKATLDIAGSIVAGQATALCQLVGGAVVSSGYNLEEDASSCGFSPSDGQVGDLNSSSPQFGALVTSAATPYEPVANTSAAYDAIPSGYSAQVLSSSQSLCESPDQDQTGTTTDTGPCSIGAVDAPWTNPTFGVTYALGGGTGTLPTQGNEPSGVSFPVASATGISRPGYSFAGWSDGTTTYQPLASYTVGASPVTLTAQWSPVAHSVTYALGGATGTAPIQASVPTGGSFVVAPATAITRAGYAFAGWSDATATYGPGATYVVGTSDVVLSAVWAKASVAPVPSHRVSFASGGASGPLPPTRSVSAGASFVVPSGGHLSRPGYVFAGWSDGHGLYQPGATYLMGLRPVTLAASWTPARHTVAYASAGGRGRLPISISGATGERFAVPGASSLSRPGYVFAGWSDGHVLYRPGATYVVGSANVVLTATWTRVRPSVLATPSCALYFAPNASTLTTSQSATLASCARAIAQSGQRVVTVVGYADETGSLAYNLRLSTRRALSVATALAARLRDQGDDHVLVHVVGAGITTTSPVLSRNRRVDVIS